MDQEQKIEVQFLTEKEIRERIQSPSSMPVLYANHTRIAPSFYDVRIFFGQQNISALGEQTVEEKACVVLTPECAQSVVSALSKALDQYQKIFGALRPIPEPDTLQKRNPLAEVKRKRVR